MQPDDDGRSPYEYRFLRIESVFHGCRLACTVLLLTTRAAVAQLPLFAPVPDTSIHVEEGGCVPMTIETMANYLNTQIHPVDTVEQSEVSIAMDPLDRSRLLVGVNTTFFTLPYLRVAVGSYKSSDGGISWIGSDDPFDSFSRVVDPAVAFNALGSAFFGYIAKPPSEQNTVMAVSTSSDGGFIWDTTSFVPDSTETDKDHIAVDVNSPSYSGYVYVAYKGGVIPSVQFSRSTDGGRVFSDPKPISGNTAAFLAIGANLAIGPGGELYAVWACWDDSWNWGDSIPPIKIGFAQSTNGGADFDTATRILSIAGLTDFLKPFPNTLRASSLPSMAVDTGHGPDRGTIYVVWADRRLGDPDIFISRCAGECDDSTNWSAPARVNSDDTTTTDQWHPWVTVDPVGRVHVVFYDSRLDPQDNLLTAVYMATSVDGGQTFANFPVSDIAFLPCTVRRTSGRYMGDYIGVTSDSEFAYPAWNDNRTGIHQAYVAKVPTNRAASVPQVSGHITANTTWDWMVDLVGDVTVDSGVTLTINPRARITPSANSDNEHGGADSNLTELIVKGTLAFEADTLSPARHPVFKSSTGEDSSWYGIRMMTGSSITGATGYRLYDAVNVLSLDGFTTIPVGDTFLVNPHLSVTATAQNTGIAVLGTLQFETDPNNPSARALLHGASGARGSWHGIWVYPGGRIESGNGFVVADAVNGIALEAGALGEVRGVRVDNAENAGFWCGSSSVSFDHDTVTGIPAGYGMYVEDCDPAISALRIQGCEYGVLAYGSSGSVTGSLIEGPGAYGVYVLSIPEFLGTDTLRLVDDSVAGSFSGAHLYAGGSGHCSIDSCSFVSTPGSGQSLYGIKAYNGAWVKLRHSKIIDYGLRGFYSYRSWAHLGDWKFDPGHNQIYTTAPCEECFVKSVYHSGVDSWDTLKAESNWWNSDPPPAIWFTSLVDYTPWLTSPPLGKLAPPQAVEPASVPAGFLLGQNYPNPFNPSTVVQFSLAAPSRVALRVFNILGQVVKELADREFPPGQHQLIWDGTDAIGRPVTSGIYFSRLVTEGHVESRKMVLLK